MVNFSKLDTYFLSHHGILPHIINTNRNYTIPLLGSERTPEAIARSLRAEVAWRRALLPVLKRETDISDLDLDTLNVSLSESWTSLQWVECLLDRVDDVIAGYLNPDGLPFVIIHHKHFEDGLPLRVRGKKGLHLCTHAICEVPAAQRASPLSPAVFPVTVLTKALRSKDLPNGHTWVLETLEPQYGLHRVYSYILGKEFVVLNVAMTSNGDQPARDEMCCLMKQVSFCIVVFSCPLHCCFLLPVVFQPRTHTCTFAIAVYVSVLLLCTQHVGAVLCFSSRS